MSEPSQSNIHAALEALEALRVPFRGPFIPPKKRRIYVVDGCILTESEIVVLHQAGQFAPETVRKFLGQLRELQTQESEEAQFPPPAQQQQRRSQRVMLRLNLLVRMEVQQGGSRQTHALTVCVNAHGGLLESPFRMSVGQKVTLVNPQTGKEVRCCVVSVQQSSEGYFTTALEFEQAMPQFWAITFPPLDWSGA
jgi:hypothetical protein